MRSFFEPAALEVDAARTTRPFWPAGRCIRRRTVYGRLRSVRRGPLRTKNTIRWTFGAGRPARLRTFRLTRSRPPGGVQRMPAVSETRPSGTGAVGRRGRLRRAGGGAGRGGTSVRYERPFQPEPIGSPWPGDPAAGAVAAVQQQRAVGRAGEDVGLAVAAEVAAGSERGEAGPAAADLLGLARHPAAGAVAAVHQQRAGRVDGEDVGLAVAAEVAAGDDRAEALPAGADRLGPRRSASRRRRRRGTSSSVPSALARRARPG